jgi:demethylmenaquinone methyltransferase/2-methoxy-6-polyprenyl-1,4-benzoquinol methylase
MEEWRLLMAIFAVLEEVKPYHTADKDKKQEVELMFDSISGKYDLLNRILSLGIDVKWRKKALKQLLPLQPEVLLDVATGTGDMAFMAEKILAPQAITGIDLSAGMLEVANQRKLEFLKTNSKTRIEFIKGDAEALPMASNTFDAATVTFGVRNFGDLHAGLSEIHRVLKPGGMFVVLEFTKPRIFPFRQAYNIYFKHILPLIGSWTSGDGKAYRYLYESVQAFPDFEAFNEALRRAGFERPSFTPLSLGICAIYTAYKS